MTVLLYIGSAIAVYCAIGVIVYILSARHEWNKYIDRYGNIWPIEIPDAWEWNREALDFIKNTNPRGHYHVIEQKEIQGWDAVPAAFKIQKIRQKTEPSSDELYQCKLNGLFWLTNLIVKIVIFIKTYTTKTVKFSVHGISHFIESVAIPSTHKTIKRQRRLDEEIAVLEKQSEEFDIHSNQKLQGG